MRTVDKVYLTAKAPSPVSSPATVAVSGRPKTRKSTPFIQYGEEVTPTIRRVPMEELELTYLNNPTIFNGVNKIVQAIMGAEHTVEAESPVVQKYFDDFIADLGSSGSDITWDELLSQIFKYQCIYGWAFIENIFNKAGNTIVDWDLIDPKKMDYAKDSEQKIVVDKWGKPVGFTEVLPYNMPVESNLPAELKGRVSLPQNSIFLGRDNIALIKLHNVGDGFYPIGLIEPIYKTSLRKMNIEEALANSIWRHGFPIYLAKVGDTNHEPTPQQVKNILKKVKDVSYKQEIAVPYYMNLEILESKRAEKLSDYLEYFREQEITGMGIPKPYATGGGEETNRATLTNQTEMFLLTLKEIVQKTTESIEKYMFKPICDLEGFREVPSMTWDVIGLDEREKKSKRLLEYLDAGIMTVEEVREVIQRFEQLNKS